MTKIRVGGVPEHFNLPWHLAIENGDFSRAGVNVEWIECKGGTGEMTQALRENRTDLCILLTEGIITDIVNGNPSRIISSYIKSPLIWGVHTGRDNALVRHQDIYSKQYAISRFGSGSHLMAQVDAYYSGQQLEEEQFSVVKNLEGALTSLMAGETDVFYWEKFTTKPYVDNGQLKRIGEYPTPWPCFVIAATEDILSTESEAVNKVLQVIYRVAGNFQREGEQSVNMVSKRYQQKPEDVKEWFAATEWATDSVLPEDLADKVIPVLKKADILPADVQITKSQLFRQVQ